MAPLLTRPVLVVAHGQVRPRPSGHLRAARV
eukprot:CAMPEP_0198600518 /NCGR_PEP_ID=MMETSP1462-20131121/148327_1 /TAXON_ID=1333877 /ORGANISM="Brandtodinium nutriculum, Strain RCC3387" /LENGTH=30 /DNA_ID= /DNA_START= /DNA_END= /DNA_ORIENTATION=